MTFFLNNELNSLAERVGEIEEVKLSKIFSYHKQSFRAAL